MNTKNRLSGDFEWSISGEHDVMRSSIMNFNELHLRGIYAKVVVDGVVGAGDVVRMVPSTEGTEL